MTSSLEAKSDQLNAVDLTEARTFTIEKVTAGNADQPFNFHLVELPGKPWRPSKGMRRVLARGWGAKNIESVYPGRRVTLFCEPSVKWAGAEIGGIRVSHMSDVGDGFSTPLALSQKQRIMYRVDPLPQTADTKPAPKPESPLLAALNKVPDISTDAERLEFSSLAAGRVIEKPTDITAADTQAIIEAAEQGATLDELRAASGAVGESS